MRLTIQQLFEALQKAERRKQGSQEEALADALEILQQPNDEQAAVVQKLQLMRWPSNYGIALLATFNLQRLLVGCQHKVEIPPEMEASITPFVTEPAQSDTPDEGEPDHGEAS